MQEASKVPIFMKINTKISSAASRTCIKIRHEGRRGLGGGLYTINENEASAERDSRKANL